MSLLKQWTEWLCAGFMPLYFGDRGSNDTSQHTANENADNRIASATDSVNLVTTHSNGNQINVTATDHGAVNGALQLTDGTVSKAFNFASDIAHGAATENAAALQGIQDSTQTAIQSVKSAYADESKTIADAYTTSKAGEQKVMVMGALAVIGIVAFKSFGKG